MAFNRKLKNIIAGTVIIAVLVMVFVIIEFKASRDELLNTMKNEAYNLTESLSLSFENALIANEELESQLVSKLDAVAALISHLELHNKNNTSTLRTIIRDFQVDNISIVDNFGKVIVTSDSVKGIKQISEIFLKELHPLFSGENEWIDLGIMNNDVIDQEMYLIARIGTKKDECILVGLSSEKILNFRKKIGIGKQIQEIADNPDIIYLLLQDTEGIITASKGLKEISSMDSDTFLINAFKTSDTKTRMIDYNGEKIFEAVRSVNLSDGSKVLNRIGLSLENIRAIQQRSMRRVALIGIGIFIMFTLIYIYLVTRKGYSELKKEHKKIKSYTDLVLENMADAVIAVNKDNMITYFNKTASDIFGINSADALGKDYNIIFKNDLLHLIKARENRKNLENKEIEFLNTRNIRRILELNISFVFDSNGNIDLLIAIINDLTEKKYLQEQIERKEKISAMGELAAGVAHEIRNPLNSISVIAQRIQNEFEPRQDKNDYNNLITTVRTEVKRVDNIIRQFLEFARPAKLQIGRYLINEILNDSISIVESEAFSKNISIKRYIGSDITLDFDKEKIKQVFLNILRNSIDAIIKDGEINCSIIVNELDIEIIISDNGSGISDDVKSKIFNLYFTTKSTGNGLGLSIVHQIISEHNGSIIVDSTEGTGTTFRITLPLTKN